MDRETKKQGENSMNFPFDYAFETFMDNQELVERTILKATHLSCPLFLELFDDGTYRTLEEVGTLYFSPGVILVVPTLTDEEYDSECEEDSFFDNAVEELERNFLLSKKEYEDCDLEDCDLAA